MGETYLDDVKSLADGGFGIEGEAGIDFSRDFARDNLQDLLAKFDQKTVEGGIDLLVECLAL